MNDDYMDNEELDLEEVRELAQRLKNALDNQLPIYMDNTDLQDVIAYLIENESMEDAKKAFEYAFKTYPDDPYLYLMQAKYFAVQQNFKEAERVLDYVEEHFDPIPELYIEQVLLAQICNRKVDALELLNKSLALDADIPEAHLLIAHEYLLRNNMEEALEHTMRAIKLDNDITEDLKFFLISDSIVKYRNPDNKIEFFKALSERMPLNSSIWSALGLTYLTNNDFDHAIEAFQFQISLDGEDPLAYVNLAESYFGKGDYESALENFKYANDNFDFIKFHIQIGKCYAHLHEYDKAMKYFLKAKDEPEHANLVVPDIVNVYKVQGKFDEARAYLRYHLQSEPQDTVAIEELINLLTPEKDSEEIADLCRNVNKDDNPFLYPFTFFFTSFCYDNNCQDLGLEFCADMLEDEDMRSCACYFMAALYIKKGQVKEGCDYLERGLIEDSERFFLDFAEIDTALLSVPEVQELLNIYNIEIPSE